MKLLKLILIASIAPVVIIIVWLSVFLINNLLHTKVSTVAFVGFTVLPEDKNNAILHANIGKELLRGQKITGSVMATENNLGLILVRFFNFGRISKDSVIFRIKENGAKDWYYAGTYRVDQFQPNEYFTFGFSPIVNSFQKQYNFEIESTAGMHNNATVISTQRPQVGAAYQFTKEQLQHNKVLFLKFIIKKSIFFTQRFFWHDAVILYLTIVLLILFSISSKNSEIADEIFKRNKVFNEIIKRSRNLQKKNKNKNNTLSLLRLILRIYSLFNRCCCNIANFYKEHKKLYFIALIFSVFLIASIVRFSYFLNPENYGRQIFYGLGGSGDYDQLFKSSLLYLGSKDKLINFNSFSNDYSILVRFYAFLFKTFGFVSGLRYSIYFLIFVSSAVCTLPIIMSRFFKKISWGGVIASLLFSFNSLSIWLASGRSVDTLTTIFFSIFVILFIISLEKKKYYLAICLGIFGFLDGFNRGIMMVNDLFALIFYAIYVIKNKRQDFIYAITPFLTLISIFILWETWFFSVFHKHWYVFFRQFNPIQNSQIVVSHNNQINGLNFFNYFFHIYFSFVQFAKDLDTPAYYAIALLGIVILFLIKKWTKFSILLLISPLFYVFAVYVSKEVIHNSLYSNLYFARLTSLMGEINIKTIILMEFLVLQFIFLKRVFIKYWMIVFIYFLMMAYGIITDFQDRHFLQILIIFFVMLGITIDSLIDSELLQKVNYFKKIVVFILSAVIVFITCLSAFLHTASLIQIKWRNVNENAYLGYVGKILPNNAVILAGSYGEDFMQVSEVTKKSVLFNVNVPDPVLIPYNKAYFLMPYLSINNTDITNLNIDNPMVNKRFFLRNELKNKNQKYQFYFLDYDIFNIKEKIKDKTALFPSFDPLLKYSLQQINPNTTNRPIFKLIINN